MVYALKDADKKLLAKLYDGARAPNTEIAKALRLSREQVDYKIKKFESEGVIKRYLPLVNYGKLGYKSINLIFFKLKNSGEIKEFKKELAKEDNRINTVEVLSKYDVAGMFIFKNEKDRTDKLGDLLSRYSQKIDSYLVLQPYFSEFYPLKFLGSKIGSSQTFHEYDTEEYELDEKEKRILSAMNKNAKARVIDIAKATNMSAELIVYKMRKLKKEGVLISSRAYFDMERIEYFYNFLLINLDNFSEKNKELMKNFAKHNEFVDSLMFMFDKPNCYLQIFNKNMGDIHRIIRELKEVFKNERMTLEIVPLKNGGEDLNALPFL